MTNRTISKLFLLWLFAAFLALAAAAIGYFRNGEVNITVLIFAAIFVAMAFVSRPKGRGSDA
jgi:membrane protein implicated in regulation of membrane protease activity